MIYITYCNSPLSGNQVVKNVWSVNTSDVCEKYIEFMHKKAKEIGVVINPRWLNMMNWQDHNNHLSIGEYTNKEQQWGKILRQWNIDKFISEVLKGKKERFINATQF